MDVPIVIFNLSKIHVNANMPGTAEPRGEESRGAMPAQSHFSPQMQFLRAFL